MSARKPNRFIRGALIVFGTFFLGLGVLGIVLPILPTTPFLLLSAACYSRGSDRFYKRLISNRWFGNYIRNYREGRGIPLRVKMFAIAVLWATISFTAFFVVTHPIVRFLLIIIAVGVTTHLLLIKASEQ